MLKAVIIDDEKHAVDSISILLEHFKEDIVLVGFAFSVSTGIEMIKNLKPDLLFLDIELKDGIGFEVVDKTKDCNYKLIFTTAYDQYAIKAFKVRALDYLLKPLDLNEFNETVRLCIDDLKRDRTHPDHMNRSFDDVIRIPEGDSYELIPVHKIVYLQADSNYTRICTLDGKIHLTAKTLKEFELKLDPDIFIRVHHSYIINKNEIISLSKGNKSSVKLTHDIEIPISRSRKNRIY